MSAVLRPDRDWLPPVSHKALSRPLAINGYYVVSLPPKKGWAIYLAEGENENEFLIEKKEDLIALATHIGESDDFATAGVTFKLTDDIPLTETWTGIGAFSKDATGNSFSGVFDGNGKTISNLVLDKNAAGKQTYMGFFGRIVDGTVKNLTIEWAGFESGLTGEYGGGALVGYTDGETLIENVTVKMASGVESITGTHSVAGFAARFASETTIKDCTNEVNIVAGSSKAGGFVAITQNNDTTKGDTTTVTFKNCVNKGSVTAPSGTGSDGVAGFVGCANTSVTFENCVNEGAVSGTSNCAQLVDYAVVWTSGNHFTLVVDTDTVVRDDIKAVGRFANGDGSYSYSGPVYATVEGGVATFVDTLAAGNTYKVMVNKSASTDTVALAKDDTVSFDETFFNFAGTVTTTAGDGYEVKDATAGKVKTYSVAAKTFNITYTYTGAEDTTDIVNENAKTFTVESEDITIDLTKITLTGYTATKAEPATIDCSEQTADVAVTITLTADAPVIDPVTPGSPIDVPAGADPAEFLATVNANKEAYLKAPGEAETTAAYRTYFTAKLVENKVVFELNTAGEKALQDSANGEIVKVKPGDIAAGDTELTVENPIQGFYYAVKQGSGIGTMAVVDEGVLADGKAISLKYHQYQGAGFYSIVVSPTPITSEN